MLRHPLARAHDAFCEKILPREQGGFPGIRSTLRKRYKLPLPETLPDPAYDIDAHRSAFEAFLVFLKANLAEQTAVRVDPAWASQAQIVQGFAEFAIPDRVFREDTLERDLTGLAAEIGETAPAYIPSQAELPFTLSEIYDADLEKRARDAYARDYTMFGFGNWG